MRRVLFRLSCCIVLVLMAAACRPSPRAVLAIKPRVVTLAPHLAELVCAAAGCEMLVAVGAYSDYPPEVRRLPVLGDVAQLNLEALLAFEPTRVIVWDGGTPAAQLARLRTLDLPVTAVRTTRLDDIATAIEQLGNLLGTPQRAAAAAADFRQRLDGLRRRYAGTSDVRVLYQIETTPVYSINRDSPISEAITLCGGSNVFADLPTLAAPVSDEAVLARAPQLVVHAPDDRATVEAYWAHFGKAVRLQPQRLGIEPDLLARAGPRVVQGVQQLCEGIDAVRQRNAS